MPEERKDGNHSVAQALLRINYNKFENSVFDGVVLVELKAFVVEQA